MKKITKEELDVFLRKHKLWLVDDPEGERADLSGANLSGAKILVFLSLVPRKALLSDSKSAVAI